MLLRRLLSLISICVLIRSTVGEGFVEEVACSAAGLTIMLNRSDPDVSSLMNDPKSQPVVYIYGHRDRAPCGSMLKNGKGDVKYNFTVNYGKECDVYLADLEPNFRISETAIILENTGSTLPGLRNKQILNQVHCIYEKNVQTYKFSTVENGPQTGPSTGGRPKPKVDMLFRAMNGQPLREARLGEILEFYISLVPDNAYKGILPKECVFSDREDMLSAETQKITFVRNSCPVLSVSEIIDPLAHVKQEVFFSKFKTFRFSNQSTVFVHCTAQVCMTKEECATSCYKEIKDSDLTGARLRFHRRKRSISAHEPTIKDNNDGNVEIVSTLNVFNEDEMERAFSSPNRSKGIASISSCPAPLLGLSSTDIIVFTAVLLAVTIASLVTIVYLLMRLKRRNKESTFELHSAAQLRSMANSSASLVDRYPGYPLHVHTGGYR